MKHARSSEIFLGGRCRVRHRVAPLLAAAAFVYLLFVSVKLAGLAAGGVVAGYGRITGEILRCHEAGGGRRRWGLLGNFSDLECMATEVWALGAKAWEEASAFIGNVDSIVSGDGRKTKCPSSLALGGVEGETAVFLQCGLVGGSVVTVVGMVRAGRPEDAEALEQSGVGNRTVMVAQFAVEPRGLRATDGEEPPRILHLNPRLRGDWRQPLMLEMNTCFRM